MAWRGEVQIHELERRLRVLRRCRAAHPFRERADRGRDADRLAGQLLAQRRLIELADAGLAHDVQGEGSLPVQVIRHQRGATGAGRGEEDLVVLEVGGLEDDPDAVLQRPDRDAHLIERFLGNHRGALGHDRQKRSVGRLVLVGFDRHPANRREHAQEVVFRGGLQALLRGRAGEHDASLLGQPRLRDSVRLLERDPGQEGVHEFHLRLEARVGTPLEKHLYVAARERTRFLVLALGQTAFVSPSRVGLLTLQFGLREPVLHYALGLGEQSFQPALDAALADESDELVRIHPAGELALAGERNHERGVGLEPEFVETRVEHAGVEPFDQTATEVGDRAARGGRLLVQHADLAPLRLGVGRDRDERRMIDRDFGRDAGTGLRGPGQSPELIADRRFDLGAVEITDRDDGHQVRAVPVLVEAAQPLGRGRLEDLGLPDRQPLRVERPLEQDRELLILNARLRPAPAPPFLDHDAALLVHLFRVEEHALSPVREDAEGGRQHLRVVHRHLQHVDGLVKAGVSVEVRTELHPDRLEVVDERLLLEVLRAVERHVFDEMREPELILVLEDGARVHDEAQFHPVLRLIVLVHEIAQAVVQRPGDDGRIRRNRIRRGRSLRRRSGSGEREEGGGGRNESEAGQAGRLHL